MTWSTQGWKVQLYLFKWSYLQYIIIILYGFGCCQAANCCDNLVARCCDLQRVQTCTSCLSCMHRVADCMDFQCAFSVDSRYLVNRPLPLFCRWTRSLLILFYRYMRLQTNYWSWHSYWSLFELIQNQDDRTIRRLARLQAVQWNQKHPTDKGHLLPSIRRCFRCGIKQ